MKKFEYKVEILKGISIIDNTKKQMAQLNEAGSEGWKLVQVIVSGGIAGSTQQYVFIREVE